MNHRTSIVAAALLWALIRLPAAASDAEGGYGSCTTRVAACTGWLYDPPVQLPASSFAMGETGMSFTHTVSRRTILQHTLLLGALGVGSAGLPAMSLAAGQPATRPARPAQDFAGLNRYRQANAALGEPAPGENRAVFMGDSITDAWPRAAGEFFSGRPYIGRGISGQTTQQMLIRFRPDVIQLKPRVVVILAGTNDLAGNTGPATPEEVQGNLMSMAELARVHGIRVILASIPPAIDFPWLAEHPNPAQRIIEMNAWIKDYAARNGFVYLDYHSALEDERHGLKREYAADAVHPNRAGYLVMGPLAEKAIAQALQAK